jgi:NADH-quinone oxidoreductase subunit K
MNELLFKIPLQHILILAALMFFIGAYGFMVRRSMITILMSIELMLNAVNINFVAFNHYLYPNQLNGQFFAFIVIAIAAIEASVAIALIINIYRRFNSIEVDEISEMKY